MSIDCVVVGGGLAGIVAAIRLSERGVETIVLERGADDGGVGNARISGGLLHVAWHPMDEEPDRLYRAIMDETDGEAGPAVARAFADHAHEATRWLVGHGVDMRPKSELPYMRHALYPHIVGVGARRIPERGPDRTMRRLYDVARSSGAVVRTGVRATGLERTAGGWTVTTDASAGRGSYSGRAVVVADGGFQANAELLTRYVGPHADRALLRASRASTGTGLQMLLSAGASAVGLGRVYGHMVSSSAFRLDRLWPYPPFDRLCLDGLLVDRAGRRFATGARTGEQLVNELVRTEDPRGHILVCDDDVWANAGAANPYGTPVPNPDLDKNGGHHVTSATADGLAEALGVDAGALQRSIDAHNRDDRIPIARPPFHAMAVTPGITFTMGGVCTDERARVLDGSGEPIGGLYACGSCTGGLHGGPRGGYVGGLAAALVFGYVAGGAVADDGSSR